MNSVTVDLTRQDYLAAQWRMSWRQPLLYWMFGLLALVLAFDGISGDHDHATSPLVHVISAIGTAAFCMFVGMVLTVAGVVTLASRDRGVLGVHTFAFEEGGLRESTSVNEHLVKLGGVRAVLRTE